MEKLMIDLNDLIGEPEKRVDEIIEPQNPLDFFDAFKHSSVYQMWAAQDPDLDHKMNEMLKRSINNAHKIVEQEECGPEAMTIERERELEPEIMGMDNWKRIGHYMKEGY
jgi:hypothetical protein